MKRFARAVVYLAILLIYAALALRSARAANFTWVSAAGGTWNSTANWSSNTGTTLGYPSVGDTVDFPGTLSGPVVLNIAASASFLSVDNQATTLTISGSKPLTIVSGIANNGSIAMSNGKNASLLNLIGTETVSGTGSIVMSSNTTLTTSGGSVMQSAGHAIVGSGLIQSNAYLGNGSFINQGLVNSNVASQTLAISGSMANTGTLEATSGGNLWLTGTIPNFGGVNNFGGMILAASGTVQLGSNFTGGTEVVSGGTIAVSVGSVQVGNGTTLSGVTLNGSGSSTFQLPLPSQYFTGVTFSNVNLSPNVSLVVPTGGSLTIANGLTNYGSITVTNTSSVFGDSISQLVFQGTQSLSGSGAINLFVTGLFGPILLSSGGTVTQAAGHSIVGAANLGNGTGYWINRGLINANVPNDYFQLLDTVANSGTLEASNGGDLGCNCRVGPLNNVGGTILASGGTVLIANSASITGGTLASSSTSPASLFLLQSGTLNSVSIAPNTSVVIPPGSVATAANGMTNNGMITVTSGSTQGSQYGTLWFRGTQTLSGGGSIVLDPSGNSAFFIAGTLTQALSHTIIGNGLISGAFINQGTINANFPGGGIGINGPAAVNSGTMEATNGAGIYLNTAPTLGNAGGTLLASNGTVMIYAGVTVNGGTLTSTGSSFFTMLELSRSTAVLSGVTTSPGTVFMVPTGSTLSVANGILDNGTINVAGGTNARAAVQLQGTQTIAGSGSFLLNSTPNSSFPTTIISTGGTVTQGAAHSIAGAGTIGNNSHYWINQGMINANVAGMSLAVTDSFSNTGIMEATSGGSLLLQNSVDNSSGTIMASGGTVNITGNVTQLSGGTLNGGTWIAKGGSPLLITSGSNITTNQAKIVLDGAGPTFAKINSLNNNQGSFSLLHGQAFSTTGSLTNSGIINVDAASSLAIAKSGAPPPGSITTVDGMLNPGGTIIVYGTLSSTGTVNGSVNVATGGVLAPGDAPGQMTLTGGLTLLSGAEMDYELETPLDSDEVYMPTSSLALNGQQFPDFKVTLLAGFVPGSYTLIDAGSVSGSLGASTTGTIDGLSASLAVQGDDLVLTVVPEPGTLGLMCGFGVGMGCVARLRRKPVR